MKYSNQCYPCTLVFGASTNITPKYPHQIKTVTPGYVFHRFSNFPIHKPLDIRYLTRFSYPARALPHNHNSHSHRNSFRILPLTMRTSHDDNSEQRQTNGIQQSVSVGISEVTEAKSRSSPRSVSQSVSSGQSSVCVSSAFSSHRIPVQCVFRGKPSCTELDHLIEWRSKEFHFGGWVNEPGSRGFGLRMGVVCW